MFPVDHNNISKYKEVDLPICIDCITSALRLNVSTNYPRPHGINGSSIDNFNTLAYKHYLTKREQQDKKLIDTGLIAEYKRKLNEQETTSSTEITTLKERITELEKQLTTKPSNELHKFNPDTLRKLQVLNSMNMLTTINPELVGLIGAYNYNIKRYEVLIEDHYNKIAKIEMEKFDNVINAISAISVNDISMQSNLSGFVNQLKNYLDKFQLEAKSQQNN